MQSLSAPVLLLDDSSAARPLARCSRINLPENSPLAIRIFPRPRSAWELFFERLSDLETSSRLPSSRAGLERVRTVLSRLEGTLESNDVLEMPFVPDFE